MRRLAILIIILLFAACGPKKKTVKIEGVMVHPVEKTVPTNDKKPSLKKPSIDLFGIEMLGTPNHIISELERNSYIQIDHGPDGFVHQYERKFSCRVLLDGIPFGMTVTFGKDGEEDTVKDVKFITSETDHHVLDVIIKNLKAYYGNPEIVDMPEEYYKWFPHGHFLHARRLHHDDGGWTFYITE